MSSLTKMTLAAFVLILTACAAPKEPEERTYYLLPEQKEEVALQNLKTRVVVYCSASFDVSTEECAQSYEAEGYTRLTNIPSQPADKDFLKSDTYPTRRWRNNELVPRW